MRGSHHETHRQGHDSCTEQNKYQKYQTNCGYKHNGTTHVVKTFIYVLDVLREHPSENHAVLKYGSTSTLSDFVQILCRVSL